MKKIFIRILLMFVIFMTIVSYNNVLFAAKGSSVTNMFNGSGDDGIADDGITIVEKVITPVLSVIRIVATGVAVIMLTYLGIKYMSAAPSEKASIKNQLITYTVGAIFVIGTTKILEAIMDFANKAIK